MTSDRLLLGGLLLFSCTVDCVVTAHLGALGGIGRRESDDVTQCFPLRLDDLSRLSQRLSSFFTNLFKAVESTV